MAMLRDNKKRYPKNSAGALMTDKVPIASLEDRIIDLEKYLKRRKGELESINYIYILDKKGVLKGAVSIKEVFRQGKNKKLSSFIEGKLISSKPFSKGESVANLALKYNIKSVPVVDNQKRFLGVVLSDTILEIAYRESQEDLSRLAGIEEPGLIKNSNALSVFTSLKHRLPWLLVGMFGGFLISKIISSFESTLAENIFIASFIPLVIYIAEAVQTQTGFLIVRDLAFNPKIKFFLYAFRQLRVILLISLSISFLVFFMAYLFYRDLTLVGIVSAAIFLSILSSIITGVCIPFIFHRLKFDPANASGPIATILQDLTSVVIYLLIAKSFL